jgi:hypothetical protein
MPKKCEIAREHEPLRRFLAPYRHAVGVRDPYTVALSRLDSASVQPAISEAFVVRKLKTLDHRVWYDLPDFW